MPVLPKKNTTVKQLYLPSTATDSNGSPTPQDQQAWIKIDMSPMNTEDLLFYDGVEDSKKTIRPFIEWLTSRIVEWNFTEEDGLVIPITFESVCRLPRVDFDYLTSQNFQITPATGVSLTDSQKKS